jgi:hypothetical protein
MSTTNGISQSLRVLLLALCGLSFYVLLIALLCLAVGLVIPQAHAHAPSAIGALMFS